MRRRVVVTGLGIISPLGNTIEDTWKNLVAGKSGVSLIEHFDTTAFDCKISAHVKNFDPSSYMNVKDIRRNDVFIHYAIAATSQAIKDAHLEITEANADRAGVAIGSGIGGLPMIEAGHTVLTTSGPHRMSPFFIPGTIINLASGHVSIEHNLRGPNIPIVSACSTGTHSIGIAARLIAHGDADIMVCGGSEMATSPLGVGGFGAMRALSLRNDAPEKASRPWDKSRDGFVLGDGAGILVLEDYETAKKRSAHIYAELLGFAMNSDAHHITSPAPEGAGAKRAMDLALRDAKINPSDVDYINAHATSTSAGDELELAAMKSAFGEAIKDIAVSSTKSMTGHLLGAAGAVEAIFSILAIRDQIAPPTINLDDPCDTDKLNLVPHHAQQRKIDIVLSNSFGFGGTNGSLIFAKI